MRMSCRVDVLLSSPASPNIDLADLLAATAAPGFSTGSDAHTSPQTRINTTTSAPYTNAPRRSSDSQSSSPHSPQAPSRRAPGQAECERQYRYIQAVLVPRTPRSSQSSSPSSTPPSSCPDSSHLGGGDGDVLDSPAPWTLPPRAGADARTCARNDTYLDSARLWSQAMGCDVQAAAFLLVSECIWMAYMYACMHHAAPSSIGAVVYSII